MEQFTKEPSKITDRCVGKMRWLKHVMDQPSQFISIQGGLLVECAVKSLKADPGLKVKDAYEEKRQSKFLKEHREFLRELATLEKCRL